MSNQVCLRLLQSPFPGDDLWRQTIAGACKACGWQYAEHWGGASPTLDPFRNAIIVGWTTDASDVKTTHWAVQTAAPDVVMAAFEQRLKLAPDDARYLASRHLAEVAALARLGAPVSYAGDGEIQLPILGSVPTPLEAPLAPPVGIPGSGLAVYQDADVPIDTEVFWPSDLFNFGDLADKRRGVRVELLGRRRLLFNGPNIWLPPGVWEACAELRVLPQEKADLLIEWGYGTEVAEIAEVLTSAGRYKIRITQNWLAPAPADFRISLMMPALAGWLEFPGLKVRRIGDAA
ncbi:MAG: hypothetical protein ACK4M2_00930 [Brevundimonas sp.]